MFWEEGSHIVRGLLVPWMGLIIGLSPFRLYQNIWLYFCTTKLFLGNWLIAIVISCATALSWFGLSRKVAELPWESYSNWFKVNYCFCHPPNWILWNLFNQLFIIWLFPRFAKAYHLRGILYHGMGRHRYPFSFCWFLFLVYVNRDAFSGH